MSGFKNENFISLGCYNRLPQTEQLKTTHIYFTQFWSLETLRPECQGSWALGEGPPAGLQLDSCLLAGAHMWLKSVS